MSKEYGLIIPNKNKSPSVTSNQIKKPSIFDEDSDSDGTSSKPTGLSSRLKRQDRVVRERAVEEDPTIFQYDEIYDEMDQKRKESKLSRKDLDKKPKYINRLLIAADRRKRENEQRIERQVQKEREAEGEEFKHKESFVTSAYKKKLEELKELEEQEKREEYLESIGDVRKQGNLDGFYRHLYDQKVNQNEAEVREVLIQVPKDSKDDGNDNESTSKETKKRHYRKREDSKSETEEVTKTLTHLPSNLDADSDFSIDSDSDVEAEPKSKKVKADSKLEEKPPTEAIKEDKEVDGEVEKEIKISEEIPEKKIKIDIWKKRTVGIVFDEALQRYYERKALRESG